ncbi:MAG: T9SS type A sorting domain-containing protein, partial [Kordia sp.]|uniref:T9SS type A sorting domain-containing protein n=1 Tax=Kordia sp. TaxID=1965332 RepID=UPI00385B814D
SIYIDNIKVESSILSVSENTLDRAISMYPNPATSNVDVVINTTIGNTYQIELLNSIGQSISKTKETRFNANARQKLDVSQYGTGLYFVRITIGNQTLTKKLIVN